MKVKTSYELEKKVMKFKIHKLDMLVWHFERYKLNKFLPRYYKKTKIELGPKCSQYTNKEVIVSLTTFPKRLNTLYIILESLYRQTYQPDRIILWLADEQFPNKSIVDNALAKYIELGLEVEYCDDLRAHKKYFYSMLYNPDSIVITVDDDVIYPEDMIEKMINTYLENQDTVVCNRAHYIMKDGTNTLPYTKWNHLAKNINGTSSLLFPTGCGGVLYPPHLLSNHLFDKEVLVKICLWNDDIWLKYMGYLNDIKFTVCGEYPRPEVIGLLGTDTNGLGDINILQGKNDEQINSLSELYGKYL